MVLGDLCDPDYVGRASLFLDCFGGVDTVVSSVITQSEQTFFPCFPCVGDSLNENLTSPQRELLLWHWKLGINMYRVQELMREQTF